MHLAQRSPYPIFQDGLHYTGLIAGGIEPPSPYLYTLLENVRYSTSYQLTHQLLYIPKYIYRVYPELL